MAETNDHGMTFGEWLIGQTHRDGPLGDLASTAKADPQFPRRGSPYDIRKRLHEMQADGDMQVVVNVAETEWLSY